MGTRYIHSYNVNTHSYYCLLIAAISLELQRAMDNPSRDIFATFFHDDVKCVSGLIRRFDDEVFRGLDQEQEPPLEPSVNGWWNEDASSSPRCGDGKTSSVPLASGPQGYFAAQEMPCPGSSATLEIPAPAPSTGVSSFASNDKKSLVARRPRRGKRCEMEDEESLSVEECHGRTDKKKLRLERNRKCARESRKKKKEYIRNVEIQVVSIVTSVGQSPSAGG